MLGYTRCGRVYWCAPMEGGSEQMRFLSYLLRPKRTLERKWQQRERELYAACARGRKRRWERAMLNRSK